SPPAPQNLPPTASDAPTRHEIATAPEPADQSQTKISQPSTEDLFKQYQAWVADEEKGAKVEPVQPVRDAPEQVVQDARPKLEIMKTHRRVWRVRHARADIQNSRRRVRQTQNARVQKAMRPDSNESSIGPLNFCANSRQPLSGSLASVLGCNSFARSPT